MKKKAGSDKYRGVQHNDALKKELKDPKFRKFYRQEGFKLAIGYKIAQLRAKLGLTQMDLARKLGTTQSFVARLECADTGNCELKTLQRIADAVGRKLVIGFQ
ncbi:MAG: XRE family transcriptional regulator [Elusimicrobia bacterium]|nr:XRE family transcriptional regulator [Candidatus Obscuribacterium magneticum]